MRVEQFPFEWDDDKARRNISRHRVAFAEAATVFEDYLSVTIVDIMHSDDEERLITIGASSGNRILVVIHTERGEWIRIISARDATQHERRQYERGQ